MLQNLVVILIIILFFTFNTGYEPLAADLNLSVINSQIINEYADSTSEYDYNSFYKLKSYLINEITNTGDLEIIDYDCAVIINPTSGQIEELKNNMSEEDFYTVADDNQYYQGLAFVLLDSLKVRIVSTDKKFLKFVGDKVLTLSIRKKNLPMWNIILFSKHKEPLIVPAVELGAEQIIEYFNITPN